MAGPVRPVHRRGRLAQGARGRSRHVLLRLRPDRALPARRTPGAGAHRAPPPAGRAPAAGAGGRCDGPDRRPPPDGGAHAERPGDGGRLGRPAARADRAVPVLRGRERRRDGEQPRLDRRAVRDRVPAGHRQALPRQQDADEGLRGPPPGVRPGHQLHGVQLPDPPGHGLPPALPALRLHAPAGRQRPVGQPHGRAGPDPPAGAGGERARAGHAADDEGRRHQVRQDRGRRGLAGPGDDDAVRVLPVLAERGRPGHLAVRAHPVLPVPRGAGGAGAADRGASAGPGRAALRWPRS